MLAIFEAFIANPKPFRKNFNDIKDFRIRSRNAVFREFVFVSIRVLLAFSRFLDPTYAEKSSTL